MYLPYQIRKLATQFDVERLQSDLATVPEHWWVSHRFEGTGHDVLLLVTTHGTLKNPDGTDNHLLLPPFKPTEYLRSLHYFREVLDCFGIPPSRARLMRLGPGEFVKPHRDLHPHWNNKVRIHIPVLSHPETLWHIWRDGPECSESDRITVHMVPGEVWVFNTFYYHAVSNRTPQVRVHLVADFEPYHRLHDYVFSDCTPNEITQAKEFVYPPYAPDSEVLRWANGTSGISGLNPPLPESNARP